MDGRRFTGDPPAIRESESYHIGLAVSSARYWVQEVVFKNYEVDQYYFPSAAPSISGMPTIFVPSTDIGEVGVPGSVSEFSDGRWVVKGSGNDIWDRSDQFHYVHFSKTGNVILELLVDSLDYTHTCW